MCGKDKKERREKRMEGVSMDKAVDLPIHWTSTKSIMEE
jgi:hypothetical protein